jgi:hypothetical protein
MRIEPPARKKPGALRLSVGRTLLSAAFDFTLFSSMPKPGRKPVPGKLPVSKRWIIDTKSKVKDGGQECPPHTFFQVAGIQVAEVTCCAHCMACQ